MSGYVFERVERYIFTSHGMGTTTLCRMVLRTGTPDGNLQHRYIIITSARPRLLNARWSSDVIAGYVFHACMNPTRTPAGCNGTFNGGRVSPRSISAAAIRNVATPPGRLFQPLSVRRIGIKRDPTAPSAAWQSISFVFYSGNIFITTPSPGHIRFPSITPAPRQRNNCRRCYHALALHCSFLAGIQWVSLSRAQCRG